ncbi:hypothetical protein PUR28_15600 [Streptomyces sp. BE308]|uniref:hypothetical protein n=1 Tax=Streptomyces sp. BE308 TaxID=3002529 RepID=UPI002E76A645|nr:hypothetical protein [Streptomyces sp. BE308]MEE1792178.1 hypothetical protein [Streptomyces sp. BE308]
MLGADLGQQALISERPSREMREGGTGLGAALVSAVSYGQQRVISDTAHHRLCFDRPDAVVRAIRDVVDRARP